MALGYESQVVNGQLINVAPGQGFAPLTFGSAYTGPGFWPRNGVYNVPPVVPAAGTWEGSTTDAMGSASGGQPHPTAGAINANGGTNYFHPTKSPLIWAVAFLAGGLALLHWVHYS
jgi:hypothetical protein